MKSSFLSQTQLCAVRAATLLLASGGSLIFLPNARAQVRQNPNIPVTPITKREELTATDLGMTEECFAQLQALMAEKAQRTPAQQKMDSHLVHLAKLATGKPISSAVKSLPLLVKSDLGGRVLVDIKASVSTDLINTIVYNGGEVVDAQPNFGTIRAWIPGEQTEWFAQRDDVKAIRRAASAMTNAGSVTGQGDTTHAAGGAAGARAIYNTDGTGVYVGVLSDDNVKAPSSAGTGDIPPLSGAEPTTQDLPGQTGSFSTSEGTAMMEIIHDIAPGASLRFATAFTSEASFAQNILNLRAAGCGIICDDVFWLTEPPFMDGIVAKSVDTVTAGGALYFSSAGNQGNSNFIAPSGSVINYSCVWEGNFVNGGAATGALAGAGTVHRYSNGTLYNIARTNGIAVLYWSDPQDASANDYDIYATDINGTTVVAGSDATQNGTQDPYEDMSMSTSDNSPRQYRVYIVRYSGADRMLHLNAFQDYPNGFFTMTTDGQTHGHSQSRNAFSVAAAPAQSQADSNSYAGPFPGTFSSSSAYENFSSEGPRRVHYLNNGAAITPGNFSITGGELRLKPDLTAADGTDSSAALSYFTPFFGTSAAAPHAAAIAALVRSYKSANATAAANVPAGVTIDGSKFTQAEMRSILINGCIDLNTKGATTGWDKVTGYGILMPKNALAFATAFANPNQITASANTDSATISWTTALPADTVVEYGTRSGEYNKTATGASGTSHSVTLTGLTGATGYFYRVRSKTAATEATSGAIFVSPERSVATTGSSIGTASIIGTTATSTANPNPTITLVLKNAGTGAAANLRITSATLGGINTTTSLPTAPGTLAAGATTSRNLSFSGITSGAKVLVVKGSYDGAYFSFSMRVNVP